MPEVARVIYNRLARGGPLQMDSTVLYYYCNQDGGTVTPLPCWRPKTPYNTYLNVGPDADADLHGVEVLPRRPCCTPRKGTWLYFTLVNKDGTGWPSRRRSQQQLKPTRPGGEKRHRVNWRLGVVGSPIVALALTAACTRPV
jgi:cell division protein YceG involved in septum cleavage